MEDNGPDSCTQLKAHPANSHHASLKSDVTDVPQTHASNIGTFVANITGVTPPQQTRCFFHSFASSYLTFISLDGSGAALPAALFHSMKEPFITALGHLRDSCSRPPAF